VTGPIAVSSATMWVIVIPVAVVWILGVVDILRRGLPTGQTVLWILIVILLPIVGTLAYFTLRKPTEREIRTSQAAAAERRGR
jgi:hypothetical protein